ncbi:MAG: hypothetical protein NTW28_10070, partial [Candidatus Solibacter sp.]|nr:hypothetical protein [Candidatus Solibacter sp.]
MRPNIDSALSTPESDPQTADSSAKCAHAIAQLLLLAALLFLLATPVLAQLGATITGTLTDSSGA